MRDPKLENHVRVEIASICGQMAADADIEGRLLGIANRKVNVKVVAEPEPEQYVVALGFVGGVETEVHGPFKTEQDAMGYGDHALERFGTLWTYLVTPLSHPVEF